MKRYTCIILIIFSICISPLICIAYDNRIAHPHINEKAINDSIVDTVLKTSLGFKDGTKETIEKKLIEEWMIDGGIEEDEPNWRCLRHFHDPIKTWDAAGLSSGYSSMVYWAQIPEPDASYQLYDEINEYSWPLARNYYRRALLTGSEEQYARMFRSLGQLMHLVSDAAVPAHVRNDPHPPFLLDSDPYEKWVEENQEFIEAIPKEKNFTVDPSIFNMAVSDTSAPSPISALWDHNEYLPNGPISRTARTARSAWPNTPTPTSGLKTRMIIIPIPKWRKPTMMEMSGSMQKKSTQKTVRLITASISAKL